MTKYVKLKEKETSALGSINSTPISGANESLASLKSANDTSEGSILSPNNRSEASNSSNDFLLDHTSNDICLDKSQRSWIDPWEITPSDEYYKADKISPLPQIVATSIDSEFANVGSVNIALAPLSEDNEYKNDKYDNVIILNDNDSDNNDNNNKDNNINKKFGPWDGVMAGCLLNIFGVILFLRLGWIIGQCGIIQTICIILLASTVTTLTSLSMSAICTNGQILGGGAYYIISRTLGPFFGGSVGILLSLGSMVAIGLYLIGFAESFQQMLNDHWNFSITGNDINDVRIWSNIFLIICLILALVGLKYVIKAQLLLLLFIVISILTTIAGTFYKNSNVLYGMDGWSNGNFKTNLNSQYQDSYDFWTVLAIFFPAVTGIMAGANISGDLRNPSSDIPKGTLSAIFLSSTMYIILAIMIGATAQRSELINNLLILTNICVSEYIIYIGVYAATLSSAIASLVGAPRILMALGQDDIVNIPGLNYFSTPDSQGNPVRGYFLSFLVAGGINCIGTINAVAPLISQFFIMVYLLINLACFIASISRSPGWRPSFKFFNKYTAFSGTILCLVIMFLLDHWYALATISISFIIYFYIVLCEPSVSWGGAFYSRSIYQTYRSLLSLALNEDYQTTGSTHWRPSFLFITYSEDYSLTKFAESLRKQHTLIFGITILVGKYRKYLLSLNSRNSRLTSFEDKKHHNNNSVPRQYSFGLTSNQSKSEYFLPVRKFQHKTARVSGKRSLGFKDKIISQSYRLGLQSSLQLSGLGILRPNTLIMKMYEDKDDINIIEYVEILRDSLLSGYGIMLTSGFCDIENDSSINWNLKKYKYDELNKPKMIDIYWIVDDGGLILLVPYVMCLATYWSDCKVRINLLNDGKNVETNNKYIVKELISKFRLKKVMEKEPRIINIDHNIPNGKTINKFEKISGININNVKRSRVLKRWLILSEIMSQNSKDSVMIFTTLPVPTKDITPIQYQALIQILSDQNKLPPTILMRGNGQQTLTFYSE